MSRRDGAIVAWHEVPGILRPPNQPSRRVRCDWRRRAHRFDDLESRWYLAVSANGPLPRAADRNHRTQTLQEEYLAFLKIRHPLRRKYRWNYCARSDRTLRDGSFEAHLSQALRARLRSVVPTGLRTESKKVPNHPYLRAVQHCAEH